MLVIMIPIVILGIWYIINPWYIHDISKQSHHFIEKQITFQDEGTEVNSKEMLAKSTFKEMDKNGDGKVKSIAT